MTQHPDDLAERGRHIFEALRRVAEHTDSPDEPAVEAIADELSDMSGVPAAPPDAPPEVVAPPPEPVLADTGTTESDDADIVAGSAPAVPTPEPVTEVVVPAPDDMPPRAPWEPSPTSEPGAFLLPRPLSPATGPSPLLSPASATEAVEAVEAVEPSDSVEEDVEPEANPRLAAPDDEPLSEMTLPRIIAIANQKGGVGKTTTSVNLGAALAEMGFRVLVVDLDPQGNASTGLGVNNRNLDSSIYDVIMSDVPIDDCIEPTSLRNLFVAPATIDLAGAEIELVPAFSRELKLRRALHEVRDEYDFTIIDCPPSLGLLTVNGLAAADDVIVPIQCEYYALEGLGQLLKNVALVRTNLNPALEVRGIVLTMYDARTKLSEAVAGDVRQHFGAKVYRNIVPRTVRLSEAPSFGQPITVFDPSSRGAIAYRELAKEVSRGATRRAG